MSVEGVQDLADDFRLPSSFITTSRVASSIVKAKHSVPDRSTVTSAVALAALRQYRQEPEASAFEGVLEADVG
jgi:hypothetical protein